MEGKAGDLVCKVAGDGLAVLHDLAVQIELHAALRQVVDGTVHVVAADGDVTMGAAAGLLHDLELLAAHKDAGVAGGDLDVYKRQALHRQPRRKLIKTSLINNTAPPPGSLPAGALCFIS